MSLGTPKLAWPRHLGNEPITNVCKRSQTIILNLYEFTTSTLSVNFTARLENSDATGTIKAINTCTHKNPNQVDLFSHKNLGGL